MMKKLITVVFLAIALLLGVGMFQDWQNTPERGCTKYDSAPDYWEFTCADGHQFFEQK